MGRIKKIAGTQELCASDIMNVDNRQLRVSIRLLFYL